MTIKLTFESDTCWVTSATVNVENNISDAEIQSLFQKHLGVKYNAKDCYYQEVVDEKEVLAYTD